MKLFNLIALIFGAITFVYSFMSCLNHIVNGWGEKPIKEKIWVSLGLAIGIATTVVYSCLVYIDIIWG